MKIAICYIGHLRTWVRTKEGQFNCLINHLHKPDIFIDTSIQNSDPEPRDFWTEERGYVEKTITNTLGDKIKKLYIEDEEIQKDLNRSTQWSRFSRCLQYIIDYENEKNIKYDLIIKNRFDVNMKQKIQIPKPIEENKIYGKKHNHFKMNDQFFLGSRDSMMKFLDFPKIYKPLNNSEKQVVNFITGSNNMGIGILPFEFDLKRGR